MNKYKNFSVTIYGDLKKYNDVLSMARCRIFYKGKNRNSSFITEDFAEKLIATIPYTPVKGIYNAEEGDFEGHGNTTDGRIYGIVPSEQEVDFAWEDHLDEDGVTRTYACVNVLLFTGLYEEAYEIVGKAQSMELYPPSIKGHFEIIEGLKTYMFEDACFLGLQTLGDDVEPCFEGAAFFELYNSLVDIVQTLEKYQIDKGGKQMFKIKFKLSDNQKHEQLFQLLNPNFNEESGWLVEYGIAAVYDEYALVVNYETQKYERVKYSKNEDDTVSIGDREEVFIVDVTASEFETLKAVQALNNGTYENANVTFEKGVKFDEEKSAFELKIAELNEQIATLTSEREAFELQLGEANTNLENMTAERDSLASYKYEIEKAEKTAIIKKYSTHLDEEKIADFTNRIDDLTAIELKQQLAFELVENTPTFFENAQPAVVPVVEQYEEGSIEELLSKYKNN